LVQAALWNGHAPHTTTGAANVNDSHCQQVNCNGGTIVNTITGAVNATETSIRCRSDQVWSSPSPAGRSPSVGAAVSGAVAV
jgi:hypothetical protein